MVGFLRICISSLSICFVADAAIACSQVASDVVRNQLVLNRLDLIAGPIDGKLGAQTLSAMHRAETRLQGLADGDGCIDEKEWKWLRTIWHGKNAGFDCDFFSTRQSNTVEAAVWLQEHGYSNVLSKVSSDDFAVSFARAVIEFESNPPKDLRHVIRRDCVLDGAEWIAIKSLEEGRIEETDGGADADHERQDVQAVVAKNVETSVAETADDKELTALRNQVNVLNSLIADYAIGLKADEEVLEITKQRDAAVEALSQMNERLAQDFVPLADAEKLKQQVSALNNSLIAQQENTRGNFVPKSELEKANLEILREQAKVTSLNNSLVEFQEKLDRDFVPKQNLESAEIQLAGVNAALVEQAEQAETLRQKQIGALNDTIVQQQEKISSLGKRRSELLLTLNSFLSDCAASPACSSEMDLN